MHATLCRLGQHKLDVRQTDGKIDVQVPSPIDGLMNLLVDEPSVAANDLPRPQNHFEQG
jgi:hypothetical protein